MTDLSKILGKSDPGECQQALAKMYASGQRPKCPCRKPAVEMYIAKIGDSYYVKRMPDTGQDHAPDCEAYEPPPELSGLGGVMGSAIKEDSEAGLTELRFDFSIAKMPGRGAPIKSDKISDVIKTDGCKLTLLSALHYFWEEAGFNRWSPAMAGKRNWVSIRKFLLQAAQNKIVKRAPFAERLYIPEVWKVENKDAINHRRMLHMASMRGNTKQLMVGIGEVKAIQESRFGHKLLMKHAPDFPFFMNEDMKCRIDKRYNELFELWEAFEGSLHIITICTFALNAANMPMLEEIAFMMTTAQWIPVENVNEKSLIEELVGESRRFTKGLRYNLPISKPLASAVLTDTSPLPTAMYIVLADVTEEQTAEVDSMQEGSRLASWTWDTSEFEIPELPPVGRQGKPSAPVIPTTASENSSTGIVNGQEAEAEAAVKEDVVAKVGQEGTAEEIIS